LGESSVLGKKPRVTQEDVLNAIRMCPGTNSDLAEEFGLDRKSISKHITRLREAGRITVMNKTAGPRKARIWMTTN